MWQKKIFQRSKNIQFYRFVYRVMYLLTCSTLDPYHKHGETDCYLVQVKIFLALQTYAECFSVNLLHGEEGR